MKNITVTIDDATHHAARVTAAELGTSVSALVKQYLISITQTDTPYPVPTVMHADVNSLQEVPMFYSPMATSLTSSPETPTIAARPPWFIDGKWVYTKDGKPRKPGAMRDMSGWTEDFDEWPDGFLDAVYGDDTVSSNTWWLNANDVLKKNSKK